MLPLETKQSGGKLFRHSVSKGPGVGGVFLDQGISQVQIRFSG
jgi:hypothetical protein